MLVQCNVFVRREMFRMYEVTELLRYKIANIKCQCYFYVIQLGASTCMELGFYKEAVKWCDEGLAISFDI